MTTTPRFDPCILGTREGEASRLDPAPGTVPSWKVIRMPSQTASFPAVPRSVSNARHFTSDRLYEYGCPVATVEAAELLVSELASNAVRHAHTPFTVAVTPRDHEVTVAVFDCGAGRPVLREPDAWGGRGLRIVTALAQDWGVCPHADGKTVYFHLPC
jgi:anti-sigma regulatory factor (Ser/Thr protein kinase)